MHTKITVAIAWAVLLASLGTGAADERAKAVVQRATEASGGADALAARRAMSCLEKGTYHLSGETIPYRGSTKIHWPDRLRLEVEDVYTIVLDGDRGWMRSDGKVATLTPAQFAEVQQQHYARWLASLTPLGDDAFKLTYVGHSRVNGAEAEAIRVARVGKTPVELYFDDKTGLLFKSRTLITTADSQEKPIVEINLFREFKKVDGVLFPTQLIIYHDGKIFAEANLYDIKLTESLPDSDFAKPEAGR